MKNKLERIIYYFSNEQLYSKYYINHNKLINSYCVDFFNNGNADYLGYRLRGLRQGVWLSGFRDGNIDFLQTLKNNIPNGIFINCFSSK